MIWLEVKEYKKSQPSYSKFGEYLIDVIKQLKHHGYLEDIQLQMNKEQYDNLSIGTQKWIRPKISSLMLSEEKFLAVYGFDKNSRGEIMNGLTIIINEVWEEE